jgi:hypothetical protein
MYIAVILALEFTLTIKYQDLHLEGFFCSRLNLEWVLFVPDLVSIVINYSFFVFLYILLPFLGPGVA